MASNFFLHISIFFIFLIIPVGYGLFFKRLIFKKDKFNLGEVGIFGFLIIFLISQLIQIFFPLNILISCTFMFLGFCLFLIFFKKILKEINLFLKSYSVIICLTMLVSVTSNLHDDVYLYQLPKINYLQQSKLVFGVINLNDFLGFNVGFYDIMAIFQLPVYGNSFVYILPVIFLFYFILILRNFLFFSSNNILKIFLYIIFFTILLRFSRSKEYGADISVLCTMFLSQLYVLKYSFQKNKILISKLILTIPFSIFLKVYAIFNVFLFFIILILGKSLSIFFNNKKVIIFSLFLVTLTFSKNIAQTGCIFYPQQYTCFSQKTLEWSIGKDLSKERAEYLEASTKGLKAHIRNNNYEYIKPSEFLEIYKYNYFKNIVRDKDFERTLVVLSILLISVLISLKGNKKLENNTINKNNLILLIISFLMFFLWFIKIPHLRYGGYNYLIFFVFNLFCFLNLYKYFNKKNFNIFLILCCCFFVIKNFKRISKEISEGEEHYPLPIFKEFKFKESKKNNFLIKYPVDSLYCGNIKFLCTSSLNMIDNIYLKFSYLAIKADNKGIKEFFDQTEKSEAYILNK